MTPEICPERTAADPTAEATYRQGYYQAVADILTALRGNSDLLPGQLESWVEGRGKAWRQDQALDLKLRPPPLETPPHHGRIISLSMVKNEQDILEPFIRHNARFVDCMIILDNASVDDTRRIAMDCARELGNVVVTDSDEFGYTQAERMTRLLQSCQSAFFADYILLLDADEFLGAADRAALLAMLQGIAPGGVGLMPWQTFILRSDDADDPPRSMRQRRAKEMPPHYKAAIRLDAAHRPELSIGQGNHKIMASGGRELPMVQLDDLPLLHFPVRSHRQLVVKSIVGWMAYLARDPQARNSILGFQWRDAFDRFVAGELGPAELAETSMRYAQIRRTVDLDVDVVSADPPSGYVRRFSTGMFGDPLTLIARSWERSLSPAPELLHISRPTIAAKGAAAATTAFDADWHWNNLFVDVPPFRFIAESEAPASVLDIGCGVGAYVAMFKHVGATAVLGVDGIPADATVLDHGEYLVQNLSRPMELGRVFDLVLCLEVAEHLDARDADTLLDNITRHARQTIIFSAAGPGQPGHGHINCQPILHWLEHFAVRGWYPNLVRSLGIRALATMSWFRRNLVVLQQDNPGAGAEATNVLVAIGNRPFGWYGQRPGIRQRPFTEALPPSPAGYSS